MGVLRTLILQYKLPKSLNLKGLEHIGPKLILFKKSIRQKNFKYKFYGTCWIFLII